MDTRLDNGSAAGNREGGRGRAGRRKEIRWSVGRKADAVMRLLRGEDLDELSRELRVEAHRLAAWREDFMAGGPKA